MRYILWMSRFICGQVDFKIHSSSASKSLIKGLIMLY